MTPSMRIPLPHLLVLSATLLFHSLQFANAAPNALSPIFNGKTLEGWKVVGCEAEVQDGAILIKAGNGMVQTTKKYGNFVFEFDWKALREEGRTDSGIYFRYDTIPPNRPWPAQYQVNLLNDQEGAIPKRPETISKGLVKTGEWNRFRLTVFGTKASLDINGKHAWTVDGIEDPTGFIGLQAEVPGGGQFLFKNIRLAELKGTLVPNPDFTQGDGEGPLGWNLSEGSGAWKDGRILTLEGNGKSANNWNSPFLRLRPMTLYRYAFKARYKEGNGCVTVGPGFLNRDYRLSDDWEWRDFVFITPNENFLSQARLGQWEAKGGIEFDAVRICRTRPVFKKVGDLLLGKGESIQDAEYRFEAPLGSEGSNFARTLLGFESGFNTYRWCFGDDSSVVYRFELSGYPMREGTAGFTIGHYVRGTCVAEVSRDGKKWVPVTELAKSGSTDAPIPAEVFPATSLLLRLRAKEGGASLQIEDIRFAAKLQGKPPEGSGDTMFADIAGTAGDLEFRSLSLAGDVERSLSVEVADGEHRSLHAKLTATVTLPGGKTVNVVSKTIDSANKNADQIQFDLPFAEPGLHGVTVSLSEPGKDDEATTATLTYDVPDFYRADYGALVEGAASDKANVWWCDAMHKIPRTRALPSDSSPAATLSAARNDREAVQIVVRPKEGLKNLTAAASPLSGPGGATIPAKDVKILWAYYHFVHHPTDKTGVRDYWPDALPPLEKPIDVAADTNQPLWILISVPKDAKAGDYAGTVSLKADGFKAEVPIKLHVWDFTLPDKTTLTTAFGLSAGHDQTTITS